MTDPTAWMGRAECDGAELTAFFPDDDPQVAGRAHRARLTIAAYCRPCPVRAECLADALGRPVTHRHGIWGAVWFRPGRAGGGRSVLDPYQVLPQPDGEAAS